MTNQRSSDSRKLLNAGAKYREPRNGPSPRPSSKHVPGPTLGTGTSRVVGIIGSERAQQVGLRPCRRSRRLAASGGQDEIGGGQRPWVGLPRAVLLEVVAGAGQRLHRRGSAPSPTPSTGPHRVDLDIEVTEPAADGLRDGRAGICCPDTHVMRWSSSSLPTTLPIQAEGRPGNSGAGLRRQTDRRRATSPWRPRPGAGRPAPVVTRALMWPSISMARFSTSSPPADFDGVGHIAGRDRAEQPPASPDLWSRSRSSRLELRAHLIGVLTAAGSREPRARLIWSICFPRHGSSGSRNRAGRGSCGRSRPDLDDVPGAPGCRHLASG